MVIGHPRDLLWSLTTGSVGQVRKQFLQLGSGSRITVIQTQVPIDSGNSGGPVIDPKGRLIGLMYRQSIEELSISTRDKAAVKIELPTSGLDFAIGVNEVQFTLSEFIRKSSQ
jgi:S1-C subfamily serine protease